MISCLKSNLALLSKQNGLCFSFIHGFIHIFFVVFDIDNITKQSLVCFLTYLIITTDITSFYIELDSRILFPFFIYCDQKNNKSRFYITFFRVTGNLHFLLQKEFLLFNKLKSLFMRSYSFVIGGDAWFRFLKIGGKKVETKTAYENITMEFFFFYTAIFLKRICLTMIWR